MPEYGQETTALVETKTFTTAFVYAGDPDTDAQTLKRALDDYWDGCRDICNKDFGIPADALVQLDPIILTIRDINEEAQRIARRKVKAAKRKELQ